MKPWTTLEIRALRDMAGDFPASAIAECLGRSEKSVVAQAKRQGLKLECSKVGLHWCPECMTWRTKKKCPVCRYRRLAREYDKASSGLSRNATRHEFTWHAHENLPYELAEIEDVKDASRIYDAAYKQWRRLWCLFMTSVYLFREMATSTGTTSPVSKS